MHFVKLVLLDVGEQLEKSFELCLVFIRITVRWKILMFLLSSNDSLCCLQPCTCDSIPSCMLSMSQEEDEKKRQWEVEMCTKSRSESLLECLNTKRIKCLSDDFHLNIAFIETIFPLHGNSLLSTSHCRLHRRRCVKMTDGLKTLLRCENMCTITMRCAFLPMNAKIA